MENHGREMGGLRGAAMEDRSTKGIHPDILLAPGREGQRIRVTPEVNDGGAYRVNYEPVPEKVWAANAPKCVTTGAGLAEIYSAAAPKMPANPRIGIGGGPTRGTLLPADAEGRKKYPMATGLLDYFPDALAAVSHLSWKGNEQHNPGQALHWNRAKSADEADTLLRHLSQRGTVDSDGVRHSVKVAWRALALLQKELEDVGLTAVVRPLTTYPGDTVTLQKELDRIDAAMNELKQQTANPVRLDVPKDEACEAPRRYTCPKDGRAHCCTLEGRKACDEMVAIEKAAKTRLLEKSRVAEAEMQQKRAEQKLRNEAAIKEVNAELQKHGFRLRVTDMREFDPQAGRTRNLPDDCFTPRSESR